MKLLVLGDAHLTAATVPDIGVEATEIDFVVVVGDLLDNRCRSVETGEEVLRSIARSVAPVGYVPGNHDYPYHDALTTIEGVIDLTASDIWEGVRFVGLGCDRFNAGTEIQYLHDPFQGDAEQVDEWLGAYRDQEFESSPPTGSDSVRSELSASELERYSARLRHLRDGLDGASEPRVLVSHVPPFNTPIDVIREDGSPLQGHHWGSVAVRHALREHSPTLCLCGHIHGAAGVVEVDGTLCVNPGYRGAKTIDIGSESVDIDDVEVDYE